MDFSDLVALKIKELCAIFEWVTQRILLRLTISMQLPLSDSMCTMSRGIFHVRSRA